MSSDKKRVSWDVATIAICDLLYENLTYSTKTFYELWI